MKTSPLLLPLLALLLVLGASTTAGAQQQGTLRYHLEATLFEFASIDQGNDNGRSDFKFGAMPSNLGVGLGYLVTNELLLGGNLTIRHRREYRDGKGHDHSFNGLALRPYLEYFLGHGDILPFIGAAVSFERESHHGDSATAVGIGFLGGAHFMLNAGASLDLSGRLMFTDLEGDADMISLMVLGGVSGWN